MKVFSTAFSLLLLLLVSGVSAQWQWHNPLPEGNEFFAGTFIDEDDGWVIGGNGSIIRTYDGGRTWVSLPNVLRSTPFLGLGVEFADEFLGLISMNNGSLLRTSDGGQNWTLLPGNTLMIQKLRKAPDGSIWGVGSLGTIARSTDAGLTWKQYDTGVTAVIFDIAFPEASKIVAVGSGGLLLVSTDGGSNWTPDTPVLSTDIVSVDFSSPTHGVAVQQPKYLLRTTDGGMSWSDTSFAVNELYQVRFASERTGWLVSNSAGSVFKTSDGGMSWQFVEVQQPRRYEFFNVVVRSDENALMIGQGGALFGTVDGGSNWSHAGQAFTRSHMHAVTALSDSSAWVFGDGSVFFSSDRGKSWTGNDTISFSGFRSGYGLSSTRIVGTGTQGEVMLSTDSGHSWSTQILSARGQIEQVHFVDENNGWLAGAHGTLARSTDAGASWIELDAGVTHDFNAIHAISADEAWTVGNGGTIYHTSDGGLNWDAQLSPVGRNLFAVHFLSENEGWAGGQLAILKTTDGGKHWEKKNLLPGMDVVYRIVFSDAQTGFFMLSRSVARSNDGGQSFYRTDYPAVGLTDLDAASSGHLWLAGSFGCVLRYTPAPAIFIRPHALDFGDVAVGQRLEKQFSVENRGERELLMSNISTIGDGFLVAGADLSPLQPGAGTSVSIAFAPQDTGAVQGIAKVFSNSVLGIPYVDLRGRGLPRGSSALIHQPDTLDFGTLLLGAWDETFVTIENRGTTGLLIDRETMSGGDSAMFKVSMESSFFLSSGKIDSIGVLFAPIKPGAFESSLLIESRDPVEPYYRIPVRGTAITPTIAVDPNPVDFGRVFYQDSRTLTADVSNIGTSPLSITGWRLGGIDTADFSFASPGAMTLDPGQTIGFDVSFTPQSAGVKEASIVIKSDDLAHPEYVVVLIGNATVTGSEEIPRPSEVRLSQTFPNPVSLSRHSGVSYLVYLAGETEVELVLFNALGRKVAEIAKGRYGPGEHRFDFVPTMLPAGVYWSRLHAVSTSGRTTVRNVQTVILK